MAVRFLRSISSITSTTLMIFGTFAASAAEAERSRQIPTPDDTLTIDATVSYEGVFGSGLAYIYLAEGHTDLVYPVVVVEGFDLANTFDWDDLYELINQAGLAETIRGEGYDLVMLDFTDATDFIQRNAFVVMELIEQVESSIDPDREIVLVGASMGGLAARYALAYMEHEGLEHRVRNFISFDVPHRGANIPLGIQYWVSFFSGLSEDAAFMLERLSTPAARQMLVYYWSDPAGSTGVCDSLREGLLADFADVGSYPHDLRQVAIANGSGYGESQGYAAGDQIIIYEYDGALIDIVGDVWAVPDDSAQVIFDGMIDYILPPPEEVLTVEVGGTKPYDNAPGGSRPSMAQMDSISPTVGDIIALHDSHCFVPTVSALDLDVEDLFHHLAADSAIMSRTPFDTIYFPEVNQEHMTITAESAEWFLKEVHFGEAGVGPGPVRPAAGLVLRQNFPNPCNPSTTILFDTPAEGRVSLRIYDVRGRCVRTLIDGHKDAATHIAVWDGKDDHGEVVPAGIYCYCLATAKGRASKKLVVAR